MKNENDPFDAPPQPRENPSMTSQWSIMQLADSAFPVGGFAHSSGLEAAVQSGWVRDRGSLENYCMESLRQIGALSLPFVRAAHRDASRLGELDARCDVILSNAVANRASRTQGRAHLETCARVFGERVEPLRARSTHLHHAPIFGATLAAIDVDEESAARVYLHLALRGVTSAAVRLGALGPLEAQRLHLRAHPLLEELVHATVDVEDAAQISPIADLLQSTHDRLYSRLFQS